MINITKATSTTFYLTLTEKCLLTNPYFLFHFKSRFGEDKTVNVIIADTSSYTDRYNKFTFIEPTTADLLEGLWDYKVFEQASASNIDITGLNEVERGVLRVIDTTTPAASTTYDSQNKDAVVYA